LNLLSISVYFYIPVLSSYDMRTEQVRVEAKLPKSILKVVAEIESLIGCSRSEVIRRALIQYVSSEEVATLRQIVEARD
jgi:metal-responsive CopG/Arc/MetJ family transcriptional regulator